ncbi:unnamed protein product, partial [Adineta steineri]
DKLRVLLSGICEYLEELNELTLQISFDKISEHVELESVVRTDVERSFYLFIKAVCYPFES